MRVLFIVAAAILAWSASAEGEGCQQETKLMREVLVQQKELTAQHKTETAALNTALRRSDERYNKLRAEMEKLRRNDEPRSEPFDSVGPHALSRLIAPEGPEGDVHGVGPAAGRKRSDATELLSSLSSEDLGTSSISSRRRNRRGRKGKGKRKGEGQRHRQGKGSSRGRKGKAAMPKLKASDGLRTTEFTCSPSTDSKEKWISLQHCDPNNDDHRVRDYVCESAVRGVFVHPALPRRADEHRSTHTKAKRENPKLITMREDKARRLGSSNGDDDDAFNENAQKRKRKKRRQKKAVTSKKKGSLECTKRAKIFRQQTNVSNSEYGVQECADHCKKFQAKYFSLECPMEKVVECRCGDDLTETAPLSECEDPKLLTLEEKPKEGENKNKARKGKGNKKEGKSGEKTPQARMNMGCNGAQTQGAYKMGGGTFASVYSTSSKLQRTKCKQFCKSSNNDTWTNATSDTVCPADFPEGPMPRFSLEWVSCTTGTVRLCAVGSSYVQEYLQFSQRSAEQNPRPVEDCKEYREEQVEKKMNVRKELVNKARSARALRSRGSNVATNATTTSTDLGDSEGRKGRRHRNRKGKKRSRSLKKMAREEKCLRTGPDFCTPWTYMAGPASDNVQAELAQLAKKIQLAKSAEEKARLENQLEERGKFTPQGQDFFKTTFSHLTFGSNNIDMNRFCMFTVSKEQKVVMMGTSEKTVSYLKLSICKDGSPLGQVFKDAECAALVEKAEAAVETAKTSNANGPMLLLAIHQEQRVKKMCTDEGHILRSQVLTEIRKSWCGAVYGCTPMTMNKGQQCNACGHRQYPMEELSEAGKRVCVNLCTRHSDAQGKQNSKESSSADTILLREATTASAEHGAPLNHSSGSNYSSNITANVSQAHQSLLKLTDDVIGMCITANRSLNSAKMSKHSEVITSGQTRALAGSTAMWCQVALNAAKCKRTLHATNTAADVKECQKTRHGAVFMSQTKLAFSKMNKEHLTCSVRKIVVHVEHNHDKILVRNATSGKCVEVPNRGKKGWRRCHRKKGRKGSRKGRRKGSRKGRRLGSSNRSGASWRRKWGRTSWRRRKSWPSGRKGAAASTGSATSSFPATKGKRKKKIGNGNGAESQARCNKNEAREHYLTVAYKEADRIAAYNVTKNCAVDGAQPCTQDPLPVLCQTPCEKLKKLLDLKLKEFERRSLIDQMTEVASVMTV